MTEESKNQRFKRLAKQRGDRALRDIHLIGNLSNRNNYEYSDAEISKIFSVLDEELRAAKSKFASKKKREIKF